MQDDKSNRMITGSCCRINTCDGRSRIEDILMMIFDFSKVL